MATNGRTIEFERMYPHAPDVVWQAIATQEGLAAWLMDNDFAPSVGHRFNFHTKPAPIGFDGTVHCEVLTVEPPRRLAYTWFAKPMSLPTTVTWTLEPVADGTRLRLEHSGFVGLRGLGVSVILGLGWRGLLQKELATMLETLTTQRVMSHGG